MSVPIAGHTDKKLYYVPKAEFDRVMTLRCSAFDRTRIFAALARINTLYMITRAGSGHIGSSFSSMDIVCWLYLNELRLNTASDNSHRDIYFSSKGHDVPALYSVLIGLGLLPFDYLHKLRRLDGLPGHPDIGTTMIETNTGSLGMGISKAKGIAYAKRACGTKGSIFVLTGDGELQEGQIWESLISAANDRLDEIVLIVDYNKIQSDTWLEKVSHLGDVEAKFRSFGWLVDRCSGHDYSALSETLSGIKKEKIRPKAIIADTIKGKGVSFMESSAFAPDDFYTYHSGAPGSGAYYAAVDELIESANRMMQNLDGRDILLSSSDHHWQKKNSSQENLVRTYAKILVEQGEKDERLVVLDGDLMVDCGLEPFWRKYPQRFIECGIAEQDMVSRAGGLALAGMVPVVHSFACFLASRANEQIFNNSTERKKIIYVGSLAGLLPAGPGHSHQAVRDISVLASVPHLTLIEPSCGSELLQAVEYALHDSVSSTYIRLGSVPWEITFPSGDGHKLCYGRGSRLRDGDNAVVFAYGPIMLTEAYEAANLLHNKHGLNIRVINMPWLNCIDKEWFAHEIKGMQWIFTIDNHALQGGQGQYIATVLAESGAAGITNLRRFGIEGIPACGRNDEVLQFHKLDRKSLAEEMKKCLVPVLANAGQPA